MSGHYGTIRVGSGGLRGSRLRSLKGDYEGGAIALDDLDRLIDSIFSSRRTEDVLAKPGPCLVDLIP